MNRSAERRIALEQGMLLAVGVAAASFFSEAEQWERPALLALLLTAGLASDRITVGVGSLRVSMADVACVLCAALAGPAPAAAMAVTVMTVDAIAARLPLHGALANVSTLTAMTVASGAAIDALIESGTIVPGDGSFAAAVLVATAVTKAINLLALHYSRSLAGFAWREEVRETTIPILPWDAVGVFVAAATAHAYVTIGIESIVALLAVLFLFRLLLESIAQAEQRAREIARIAADRDRYMQEALVAEERERRRLVAELHDDALQGLLSARADLVEGLSGDETRLMSARDAVAATVGKLRDLIVRIGPEPSPGPVGPAVRGLAQRLGQRGGFDVVLDVSPEFDTMDDQLVFQAARELLVNAAKHARASRVEVGLRRERDRAVLEVVDDGIGFTGVDRAEKLAAGHIGMALLEQRIASRGGTLIIGPGDDGGTRAQVTVPAMAPASPAPAGAARSGGSSP